MPTMNVSLSAEFVKFVEHEVETGEYGSASEVVRTGLRLLQREKALAEEREAVLRREIEIGLEQVRAGRFSERSVMDILAAIERDE